MGMGVSWHSSPKVTNNMKKFTLAEVLSITTSRLFTQIGKVYEILNYMTGDNLYTHQLPRACKVCAPVILEQFPQLADVDASAVDTENWEVFLSDQLELYGNEFELIPLSEWEHIDPIIELLGMMKK